VPTVASVRGCVGHGGAGGARTFRTPMAHRHEDLPFGLRPGCFHQNRRFRRRVSIRIPLSLLSPSRARVGGRRRPDEGRGAGIRIAPRHRWWNRCPTPPSTRLTCPSQVCASCVRTSSLGQLGPAANCQTARRCAASSSGRERNGEWSVSIVSTRSHGCAAHISRCFAIPMAWSRTHST
jgi:hypothetical protein